jgi:quercetin dioxygenase-like cupin family protein
MKTSINSIRNVALAAILTAAAALNGAANAQTTNSPVKLLTANFASRQVVQVEVGDFHFTPGQVAPVHTHTAPAVGYVAKGMIIYQLEGGKPQILRAGDAFFEPTGTRVLRFDNASATHEAIFLEFNLEQSGEPFIVFEEQPTEAIDRRTLPTITLGDDGKSIKQTDVYTNDITPGGNLVINNAEPTLGLVAEGVIDLRIIGEKSTRIVAGGTFDLTDIGSEARITNASGEAAAKLITFTLQ